MITVSPDPLVAGGSAEVCVHGVAANTTITVDIDNGDLSNTQYSSVEIETDANGDGCATWSPVPSDWDTAKFNYGDCPEISRPIVSPVG